MDTHSEVKQFLVICDRQTQVMNNIVQRMKLLRNGCTEKIALEIQEELRRELEYNLFILEEFDLLLKRLQNG